MKVIVELGKRLNGSLFVAADTVLEDQFGRALQKNITRQVQILKERIPAGSKLVGVISDGPEFTVYRGTTQASSGERDMEAKDIRDLCRKLGFRFVSAQGA